MDQFIIKRGNYNHDMDVSLGYGYSSYHLDAAIIGEIYKKTTVHLFKRGHYYSLSFFDDNNELIYSTKPGSHLNLITAKDGILYLSLDLVSLPLTLVDRVERIEITDFVFKAP